MIFEINEKDVEKNSIKHWNYLKYTLKRIKLNFEEKFKVNFETS